MDNSNNRNYKNYDKSYDKNANKPKNDDRDHEIKTLTENLDLLQETNEEIHYDNTIIVNNDKKIENILDANAVEDISQGSSEEKEDITVPKTEKKLTTTTILIYILLAIVGIMLFLFIAITQLLLIWWVMFLIALPWAVRAETYLNKHGHPRSYKRIIYNSMKGPYFIYKFRKAFNHF